MTFALRLLCAIGALYGAGGIALMATAAHQAAPGLTSAAALMLGHAGALIAIAAAVRLGLLAPRFGAFAAGLVAGGVALFCADMAARALLGDRLFAMAAPAGGSLAIIGWLGLVAATLRGGRRDTDRG